MLSLSINGENYGLFVLEEGFGKELIERNNRRSGPIFSLNEDLNYTNIDPVFEIYNKKFWEKEENKPLAIIASHHLFDDWFEFVYKLLFKRILLFRAGVK